MLQNSSVINRGDCSDALTYGKKELERARSARDGSSMHINIYSKKESDESSETLKVITFWSCPAEPPDP